MQDPKGPQPPWQQKQRQEGPELEEAEGGSRGGIGNAGEAQISPCPAGMLRAAGSSPCSQPHLYALTRRAMPC